MKKKLLVILGLTMVVGCMTACGSDAVDTTNTTEIEATEEAVETMTYEFETFDGLTVVIDESNIISQESCDEPLEWTGLPADAEQVAPGRDFILFETADNYYVEDATNNLVTVAAKDVVEIMTYEFETFDGYTVVINEGNLVSQESCDDPLEWAGLPADAEQTAPGRDFILFEDAENYYVEDVVNNLVTVAFKELGDVIEDSTYAIFDNNIYSFEFDSEYFVVNEDSDYVTVSFYNEETQTAGSNTITFTVIENADPMDVAKEFAAAYGVDEANITESNIGEGCTAYTVSVFPTGDEEGVQIRTMAAAIDNGDNVITFEVLSHVEPDEGMDMFISDKIAEVLDTLTIF